MDDDDDNKPVWPSWAAVGAVFWRSYIDGRFHTWFCPSALSFDAYIWWSLPRRQTSRFDRRGGTLISPSELEQSVYPALHYYLVKLGSRQVLFDLIRDPVQPW
jgi:hypothetical protein